jgi:hypothetical protein
MKTSHFTTPRTMGECQFALNADPIERTGGVSRMDPADKLILWASALALIALAVILAATR